MNLVSYKKSEEYEGLIGELVSGTVEFRKNAAELVYEYKYFVAETITKHPIYKKFGKGNQSFITDLITDVNRHLSREEMRIGKSSMYDLLAVYEAYPDKEKAVAEISKRGLHLYRWHSFLELIGRGEEDSNALETTCKHCKIHCPK